MGRLPALLFVLLLLLTGVPTTQGDTHDEDASSEIPLAGLALPVQTIVDAFPGLVRDSIEESEYDGEPHRARETLRLMREHVKTFEAPHEWPDGTPASQISYQEALGFAHRLVDLAGELPGTVSSAETVRAYCTGRTEASGPEEARDWLADARSSEFDLRILIAGLEAAARDLPVEVDVQPLVLSLDRLGTWGEGNLEETLECTRNVAVRHDVYEPDERFEILVSPTTTWPTGQVQISGAIGRDVSPGPVRLTSPGIVLDRMVELNGARAFHLSHQVPRSVSLGPHEIQGETAGLHANTSLEVGKAPLRLVLSYPERVRVDEAFQIKVRVVDVLGESLDGAQVQLSGDLEEGLVLEDGRANATFTAPGTATTLTGAVNMTGDALRRDAQSPYTIRVRTAEQALSSEPGGPAGEDWLSVFDDLQNLLVAVGALMLLAFAWLVARRIGRRPMRRRRPTEADGGLARIPRRAMGSLVLMLSGLHLWCVRIGILERTATVRDLNRRFGTPLLLQRSVDEFERVRYGQEEEDRERTRGLLPGLQKGWRVLIARHRP